MYFWHSPHITSPLSYVFLAQPSHPFMYFWHSPHISLNVFLAQPSHPPSCISGTALTSHLPFMYFWHSPHPTSPLHVILAQPSHTLSLCISGTALMEHPLLQAFLAQPSCHFPPPFMYVWYSSHAISSPSLHVCLAHPLHPPPIMYFCNSPHVRCADTSAVNSTTFYSLVSLQFIQQCQGQPCNHRSLLGRLIWEAHLGRLIWGSLFGRFIWGRLIWVAHLGRFIWGG